MVCLYDIVPIFSYLDLYFSDMDLSKEYALIHFQECDRVEVIPSKWLISCSECWYPPYESTSQIVRAIQTQKAPEENWVAYAIKILYTTGKEYKLLFITGINFTSKVFTFHG